LISIQLRVELVSIFRAILDYQFVICREKHMDLNLVIKVRSFSLPDGGPKLWRQGKTLPTQMGEGKGRRKREREAGYIARNVMCC
jgi:hypothetical protein